MRVRGIFATNQWERLRNQLTQDTQKIEHNKNPLQHQHKTPKNVNAKSKGKLK